MPALAFKIKPSDPLTLEDYLEYEEAADERSEFLGGQIVAMAGASKKHERAALNLAAAIHGHLRGKPCEVFKCDLKLRLRVNLRDLVYYPDILVSCDPRDTDQIFSEYPKALIEVLSSNEDRDLVEKYLAYQTIETLEEYIVVSQDPDDPFVEIFRKRDNWVSSGRISEGEFQMESIDLRLDVSEIYES